MKLICVVCLLFLFPALSLNKRQSYEGLERKLKEVFTERAGILRQLSKTSNELDNIKGNLKSLKNGERVPKKDVQRILELSQKQRDEMKSLQAALQKQLDEATERAEKQQATINFLKTEMERKSKIIKDLQQENKSLKNKLLSGNKLCGIHAEESKKIQAQLKELRYGKKDLIFKESQLKALKDTAHLCFSSVLHNQPSNTHGLPSTHPDMLRYSNLANNSRVTYQQPHGKDIPKILRIVTTNKTPLNVQPKKTENTELKDCQTEKVGENCFQNQTERLSFKNKMTVLNLQNQQKSQQWLKVGNDIAKPPEDTEKTEGSKKKTQQETP
ncbi:leucine zipper protein 2 isoform X3 [Anguilla rostrata]|uniref:leucine zipper protein 2 isoform X3 n=1 Tax=Anguilla rostrata TaxID=7938 RepID=UPI0030D37639